MKKLYVIECGGRAWNDRFVHAQDLPWNEWSKSDFAGAKNFTEAEAKELIKNLGQARPSCGQVSIAKI